MHLVYGIVYYYAMLGIAMTFVLAIFKIKKLRQLIILPISNKKIIDNQIVVGVGFLIMAVIGVVLVDSLWTYMALNDNLQKTPGGVKNFALDKFEVIQQEHHSDYLHLYKNYREYYLAERNFMLTTSALLITFIFYRMFAMLTKLTLMENQMNKGTYQPEEAKRKKVKSA